MAAGVYGGKSGVGEAVMVVAGCRCSYNIVMTYQGTIRAGVVVLDAAVKLPEGARVNVEPVEKAPVVTETRHFHPVPSWEGPEGELDELLAQVQKLRDADLTEDDDGAIPS